jgi:hypothetical protein
VPLKILAGLLALITAVVFGAWFVPSLGDCVLGVRTLSWTRTSAEIVSADVVRGLAASERYALTFGASATVEATYRFNPGGGRIEVRSRVGSFRDVDAAQQAAARLNQERVTEVVYPEDAPLRAMFAESEVRSIKPWIQLVVSGAFAVFLGWGTRKLWRESRDWRT